MAEKQHKQHDLALRKAGVLCLEHANANDYVGIIRGETGRFTGRQLQVNYISVAC